LHNRAPYSVPSGSWEHSGAYFSAQYGSKIHGFAQLGVLEIFFTALSGKPPILKEYAERTMDAITKSFDRPFKEHIVGT
jgi:hypothetical protein